MKASHQSIDHFRGRPCCIQLYDHIHGFNTYKVFIIHQINTCIEHLDPSRSNYVTERTYSFGLHDITVVVETSEEDVDNLGPRCSPPKFSDCTHTRQSHVQVVVLKASQECVNDLAARRCRPQRPEGFRRHRSHGRIGILESSEKGVDSLWLRRRRP